MAKKNSSFATVAEQIISYNNNVLELLTKLNDITVTNKSSVTVKFSNTNGVLNSFEVPSIGFLNKEIQRLNNNLNTLYSIDSNGSLIQTSNNKFKKIITVDLNREPNPIDTLNLTNTFVKNKNWFFDGLLNPLLSVPIDLTDKVEYNVRKVLIRRYIALFEKTNDGDLTPFGQSALNSFNENFRNKNNIQIEDYIYWYQTTPGLVNPTDPTFDEQMFDVDPNELLYDGIFSVLKTEEDTLNQKLWYHVNTLDYIITGTGESRQLSIDDELIINKQNSSTRYKIIEISNASSNFRLRFERVEGIEPIPISVGALKLYSPIIPNKVVRVSIDYDSRNVIFIKPLDANTHILSRGWSSGVGFWSNDLTLDSQDDDNGKTMEQFYSEKVLDYGRAIQNLVEKKIPDELGGIPNIPILISDNFKVVQINKHLTDSSDSNLIKKKFSLQKDVKSEITQLTEAIQSKQKELRTSNFSSKSAEKRFDNELNQLINKKQSKSKLLSSTVSEIISLSSGGKTKASPKFKVRGFWDMPNAFISRGTKPQEIIQFKIQYRYLSKDGKENKTETFKISKSDGKLSANAAFSNWNEILTDTRSRVKNDKGDLIWEIQDVSNADTPNINQLDISIQSNESVEIRVKSISEVGWPDNIIESDWSETFKIEFPDDLSQVVGEDEFILREASSEELKVRIEGDLSAKGLDDHLSETVAINDIVYLHSSDKIISGFKDGNNVINLFDYLKQLTDKINILEEEINKSKGILQVTILRSGDEIIINNGEEVVFNVECEDYLNEFTGSGVPTGRVYSNEIYTINDFLLRVENSATKSPLGLLSNRTYYSNQDNLLSTSSPQIFWVNDRDELLFNNSTGNTRNQLDNQFIWSVNFTTVDNTNSAVKLSDNIGNGFVSSNSNSLTSVLSTTEYNIGYSEVSILDFISSNNSLLESNKWVDDNPSVASNSKLLTTIHPVIQNMEDIVENNSKKEKILNSGVDNSIELPINIYFKMNSLDANSGTGLNYEYINLNNSVNTTKHIKKIKFFLENSGDSRPFVFTLKFNINRNKLSVQKIIPNTRLVRTAKTGF